jgi:hypothetical protein
LAACCYCPAANHMQFNSSHLVSSRVRVQRVQKIVLCCVTRGMILCTRHMCCWCMRQRRNCAVVVVAVERLLFHCLCRRARAFCGDVGLEYLILNSTPRIPSFRLLVFTYVSETTKARSKSAVMAQVCGQCHVRCINKR